MSSSNVSAVTNLFPTANEGFTTTLSGTISSGATSLGLTSTTGLTNGSVFVGIIEPGGVKEQTFTGTVDTGSGTITGVKWTRNSNVAHTAGVPIVDYVTGTAINMITKGLLVSHNPDGTLKTGAVSAATMLASNVVTTAALGANAVTAAKIGTPYAFSLYKTGNQSIANATAVTITFNAELFDTGSLHDTVTNNSRVTIPTGYDGYWLMTATIKYTSGTAGGRFAGFNINGALYKLNRPTSSATAGDFSAIITEVLKLNANDYVELFGYADGGTGATVQSTGVPGQDWTGFSGYFIGKT